MTGASAMPASIVSDACRRSRRRLPAAVAVLGLVASACGPAAPAAAPDATGPTSPDTATETYAVGVDGSTDEFNAMFLHFFPERLTVHPGATIVFQRPENGEPHTVTLGTDIPTRPVPPGSGFYTGGFGTAPKKSASMPCFLAEGQPPTAGCSAAEQEPVPFDGTQSWVNSGGLLDAEDYTLELADDIAPGTYSFVCLVHTDEMEGTIEVVEPGQPAEDPADVAARGADELEEAVAAISSRVEEPPSGGEHEVVAAMHTGRLGTAPDEWALVFSPEEVEVPVGEPVTWIITGDHTISFNAPEAARPFYEHDDDGSVRENEFAVDPQGDPDGWDGSGTLNSGMRSGFAPPDQFSVTFTQPGTYPYRCLIHFDMEGTVTVVG